MPSKLFSPLMISFAKMRLPRMAFCPGSVPPLYMNTPSSSA